MSGSQSPPLPLRSRKLKEEAVVEFSEISPSTIIVDPPESPKKSPKKKSAKKKSPKKKSQKKKQQPAQVQASAKNNSGLQYLLFNNIFVSILVFLRRMANKNQVPDALWGLGADLGDLLMSPEAPQVVPAVVTFLAYYNIVRRNDTAH